MPLYGVPAWARAMYLYHVTGTDMVGQLVDAHVLIDHPSMGLALARPNKLSHCMFIYRTYMYMYSTQLVSVTGTKNYTMHIISPLCVQVVRACLPFCVLKIAKPILLTSLCDMNWTLFALVLNIL